MPTISPAASTLSNTPRLMWSGIATGDTIVEYAVRERWGLAMSVQISGTFGGATVKLQHSNDGSTWFDVKDLAGTTVSATSASIFEASVSSLYLRPSIASGSANSVSVIVVMRGI